ncbi:hypothetical protein Tcan_09698, partial [Toxocara canis]
IFFSLVRAKSEAKRGRRGTPGATLSQSHRSASSLRWSRKSESFIPMDFRAECFGIGLLSKRKLHLCSNLHYYISVPFLASSYDSKVLLRKFT